jgi:hypothetical protein
LTLACIYRSPQSEVYKFIDKLETLIVKIQQKGKRVILCGDWNINFLHNGGHLAALQNVLVSYNLRNTVTSATRVTNNSALLLDIMILDNFGPNSTEVLNLGYSDHLGQILKVSVIKQEFNPVILKKRNFSQRNVTHFKDLLYREEWTDVYSASFLNDAYLAFLGRFLDYFNAAFPVKLYKQKKIHNDGLQVV